MKIVFIGSGNVATHLSLALKSAGNDILQIYSRNFNNAQALAEIVNAQPIDNLNNIISDADLYIFSIKDDALSEIIELMPVTFGIWVHTSGSVPIDLFEKRDPKAGYGVIYPLQTFSKARKVDFSKISIFIEASSKEIEEILISLSRTISDNVRLLDSESRKFLHLSAVFANNFSNHMFTLSYEILKSKKIPFDVLRPLISETAAKVMEMEPAEAQTGPAIRLDENILNKHLDLIEDIQLKEIYSILSKSINNYSVKNRKEERD